jgi:O-antigen/teichoic acid export membrane protein
MIGALLFLGITLLGEDIIKIISTEIYYQASTIVPYIALSYLFFGIYFMINIGISIKKKTEYSALILGFSAVVNIILNYILIPKYGINGAAISTLISYLILLISAYFINNKLYDIKYQWSRIFKIAVASAIIIIINLFIPDTNIIVSICLRSILAFTFLGILYLFKFFEETEIRKVKEYIKRGNRLSFLKR